MHDKYVYEDEIIKEFADLVPMGLSIYGYFDGEPVYSNEKIINFVLNGIKNTIVSNMYSKIVEGIEKKKILIGFTKKPSVLKFIYKHVSEKLSLAPEKKDYTFGMFNKDEENLIIILDDKVSLLGKALFEIPETLVHELIHFAFYSDYKAAYKNTSTVLLPYYKFLVNTIDQNTKTSSDKLLEDTLINIIKVSEVGSVELTTIFSIWKQYFIDSGTEEMSAKTKAMFLALPFLCFHLNKNVDRKLAIKAAKLYYIAYKQIGINNAIGMTMVGQEFFAPSEVICIANQKHPTSGVIRIINNINF